MAIRLICECGSFSIERGPTSDLVDITSQTDAALRRLFGTEGAVKMSGRKYLIRIPSDRLSGFFTDIFERYGA